MFSPKTRLLCKFCQVKEMSSFLTESSWNIVKLGLNLIPILTTIYLKTSVTERGRDRPHSCCRCGSNSDKSAGQGWYLCCHASTYSQHTGTCLQSFMFIWQSNVPVMSYSTQIKEIIEADSYEQILQNVRDGDGSNWGLGRHLQKVCRRTLHGQKRRFLEIICEEKSSTTMRWQRSWTTGID